MAIYFLAKGGSHFRDAQKVETIAPTPGFFVGYVDCEAYPRELNDIQPVPPNYHRTVFNRVKGEHERIAGTEDRFNVFQAFRAEEHGIVELTKGAFVRFDKGDLFVRTLDPDAEGQHAWRLIPADEQARAGFVRVQCEECEAGSDTLVLALADSAFAMNFSANNQRAYLAAWTDGLQKSVHAADIEKCESLWLVPSGSPVYPPRTNEAA